MVCDFDPIAYTEWWLENEWHKKRPKGNGMERRRIKKMGTDPMNGNDAYAILGVVGDWIEGHHDTPSPDPGELQAELEAVGYYFLKDGPVERQKAIEALVETGMYNTETAEMVVTTLRNAGIGLTARG